MSNSRIRQSALAEAGFEPRRKATRRERFRQQMDQLVPWQRLCALIEPFTRSAEGRGDRPWEWSACCAFTFCSLSPTSPTLG